MLSIHLFFTCSIHFSQSEQGDVYLSGKMARLDIKDYTPRLAYGAQLDVMATNRLGLHWSILGGSRYVHANAAPIAGVTIGTFFAALGTPSNNNVGVGIVMAILISAIPEGVSYEMNLSPQVSIAPYISPLQMDFIRNENQVSGADTFIGLGVGTSLNKYIIDGRVKASIFGEGKVHYNNPGHPGLFYGFSIGYRLNKRDYQIDDEFQDFQ